jgi:enoyl-CoA hydratase/carnithine racemase
VLHEFDIDEAADVAVLRGNGRAFCSGADVHQRQLRSDEDLKRHGGSQGWGAHAADLFTRAINWKPVIAAPHGFAVGLGPRHGARKRDGGRRGRARASR